MARLYELPTWADKKRVYAVVETPRAIAQNWPMIQIWTLSLCQVRHLPASHIKRNATDRIFVEPISKSSEEDNEASELDKAEEVLSVVLPADKDATLPLYPGEEALDEPAPHVTA
jgi:hypothetical protein